jgi:hypothetical protein
MSSLQRRGLGSLIHSYAGCFAPKFVNRDPTAMISHHSWGVAFDCNFPGNAYGEPPHQDPRLVRTMERRVHLGRDIHRPGRPAENAAGHPAISE